MITLRVYRIQLRNILLEPVVRKNKGNFSPCGRYQGIHPMDLGLRFEPSGSATGLNRKGGASKLTKLAVKGDQEVTDALWESRRWSPLDCICHALACFFLTTDSRKTID
jgi:hypothetical protein